jgi:hypothetical protein
MTAVAKATGVVCFYLLACLSGGGSLPTLSQSPSRGASATDH